MDDHPVLSIELDSHNKYDRSKLLSRTESNSNVVTT